jgi:hypothetical protein
LYDKHNAACWTNLQIRLEERNSLEIPLGLGNGEQVLIRDNVALFRDVDFFGMVPAHTWRPPRLT